MTFNKKKVFVLALAVCLAAVLSAGTLAWFSATDRVSNDFLVADSEDTTPEAIFSVDVWEYTETSPTDKVPTGDTYTDVLPGDVLKKEPHVANTGHYDQYVRVIVEISDAAVWQRALGNEFNDDTLLSAFGGFDVTKWNHVTSEVADDKIRIVLYANDVLKSGDDITVFKTVTVPAALTQESAAALGGGFTVEVKAQAVQTENVGDNAYAVFQTVNLAI